MRTRAEILEDILKLGRQMYKSEDAGQVLLDVVTLGELVEEYDAAPEAQS